MEQPENLLCPFCDFSDHDSYFLLQHVELCHPENGVSPFLVKDEVVPPHTQIDESDTDCLTDSLSIDDADEAYMICPRRCGETVTIAELPNHMEMHFAEGTAFDGNGVTGADFDEDDLQIRDDRTLDRQFETRFDTSLPKPLRNYDAPPEGQTRTHRHSQHKRDLPDWRKLLLGSGGSKSKHRSAKAKHAAKAELGPHAHEERMPAWLRKQLEQGAKVTSRNTISSDGSLVKVETIANETRDIIPVLGQLCEQDPSVERAFLCHPGVQHVVKMSREGGFCGYRNIQMMVSFIQATQSQGFEHFRGRIPSILRLQDLIELAWDQGINSAGRIETGGIRGTRKYIGTPEAQALFLSLGIGCEANAFGQVGDNFAYERLLDAVEQYFVPPTEAPTQRMCRTSLPPIYFQHPGHSLTIVGFEKRRDGTRNLLVFDPMFKPSPGIQRLIGTNFTALGPEHLLKAYRRCRSYLRRYKNFEMLRLSAHAQPTIPQPAD